VQVLVDYWLDVIQMAILFSEALNMVDLETYLTLVHVVRSVLVVPVDQRFAQHARGRRWQKWL
jgi:hypothetical protein